MLQRRTVLLGDVVTEITVGHVGPMASKYSDAGIPFLRSQNVQRHRIDLTDVKYIPDDFHRQLRKSALQPGDVVVVRTGVPGACAVIPSYLEVANCADLVIIRPGPDVNPRYLAYYINSEGMRHVDSHLVGAVQQHFNVGAARKLPIHLPSLAEQRRIAFVLGSLDDKIEHNRRTARALERLARAIFKAWFVDFEPVKAKAEGATSFPSVPQEVFDALPTTFVDTEIGPVPEGWEVNLLNELATLSRDQLKPTDFPNEIFDHFSLPAFDDGRRPAVDKGTSVKSNKFIVKDGSVLLSKLNPRFPRVWLPQSAGDRRQIASTEFLVFEPHRPYERSYIYLLFLQNEFQRSMVRRATGTSTSHQRIKPKDLLQTKVIAAPTEVRKAFDALVTPLLKLVELRQNESDSLARTRDYLLPKLMSGEVLVRDDEDIAKDAA